MYYIKVVDKNNKKQEIFSSRSQVGIDVVTTSFDNESTFLEAVHLDSNFKVLIQKRINKKLEDIPYTDYRFREIMTLDGDVKKQNEFLEKVSKLDRERLYEFYLNESINRYEEVDNDYDKKRREELDKVIKVLQEDNSENEETFSENLLRSLKSYYHDQYGNFLYDNAKKLFEFLIHTKLIEPEYRELTESEKYNVSTKIVAMRAKIQKNIITKNGKPDSFVSDDETFETKSEYDDEQVDDYVTDVADRYDDIDTKMAELDIFLDSKKMDNEQKNKYIEENKTKLFK